MGHIYKIFVLEDETSALRIFFEVQQKHGDKVKGRPLSFSAAPRGYVWYELSMVQGEVNYISDVLSYALPRLDSYTHAGEWPENRIFQDLIWSWSTDDKRPAGRPMSVAISMYMYEWWRYLSESDRVDVLGHITNEMQRMYRYLGFETVDQVRAQADGTLLRLECRGNQANGLALQTDGVDGLCDITPAILVAHNVDYIDQQLVLLVGASAFEECYQMYWARLRTEIADEVASGTIR